MVQSDKNGNSLKVHHKCRNTTTIKIRGIRQKAPIMVKFLVKKREEYEMFSVEAISSKDESTVSGSLKKIGNVPSSAFAGYISGLSALNTYSEESRSHSRLLCLKRNLGNG